MFNKIIILGNLTRDVELRYTPNGLAIAKLSLASNRRWRDKNSGEDKEEVLFIDVSIFGRSGEVANQHLKKGSKILVEGRLQMERWVDQNGQNRTKHSVVAESFQFLDPKESSGNSNNYDDGYSNSSNESYSKPQNNNYNPNSQKNNNNHSSQNSIKIEDDEDIPF